MQTLSERIKSLIRTVPDFPQPGILFRDITPVLARPDLVRETVDFFAGLFSGEHIDSVAGVESRGFIFGMPLALKLNASFIPVRKPSKLPWKTISCEYSLEYGTNRLEMHVDAVEPGHRVIVVDDLLATGGTAAAACALVEKLGGKVAGVCFVVELLDLKGRQKLEGYRVESLVTF